jgi:hypothetical protein
MIETVREDVCLQGVNSPRLQAVTSTNTEFPLELGGERLKHQLSSLPRDVPMSTAHPMMVGVKGMMYVSTSSIRVVPRK